MTRVSGDSAGAVPANLLLGLAAQVGNAETVEAALQQIVDAGLSAVEGACEVAVLRFGSEPTALAATGSTASELGALERECDGGPSITAAGGTSALYVEDLRAEHPWPLFAARAIQDHGIVGMLCCPVPDGAAAPACLAVLAGKPNAFDEDDVATASVLAGYAVLALTAFRAREEAVGLQTALANSREIGIAMGILMNRHLVTRDDAFSMLVAASQNTHRKLRAVAAEVADTGVLEVPESWNRLRGASGQPVTSAHVRVRGGTALVIATGEFDLATAHLLGAALDEARGLHLPVRLDMSAVSFVDASALDVIADAERDLVERNCPFTILRPASGVLHSLRLARLDGPVRTEPVSRRSRRG
jgi:anti-anti-sigma factor